MASSTVVQLDTLRSLIYTSISGTYAAVGTPFTFPVKIICFTNNTDGDMFFSADGVNDNFFLPARSFKLFDVTTNRSGNLPSLSFSINTQFYVKQSTAPTEKSVYIECLG